MIDDPLSLLMQGIWLLAAGMYPLGFMFGTCSACCCRNNTCEGFDLDEAFGGVRTQGSRTVCSYSVNGSVITVPAVFSSFRLFQPGCRVYGQGIPPGAVVISVEDVYNPPRVFTVTQQGCCRIEADYNPCTYQNTTLIEQSSTVITLVDQGVRTAASCAERAASFTSLPQWDGFFQESCPNPRASQFRNHGVVVDLRQSFTPCVDCSGQPAASTVSVDNQHVFTGFRVTISPAPSGAVTGCLTFCGTGGKCGPFSRRSSNDGSAFGPYGAGVPIPGGCCNIQYQLEDCGLVDGVLVPIGNIRNVSDVREASSSSECSQRVAGLSTECGFSQFGGGLRVVPGSITSNYAEGFSCDGSPRRTYPSNYRRNCVRWVCRCYEGTGKRGLLNPETGQPLFPNRNDWYTVQSTNVIGGPTTNDIDLEQALSDARNNLNVPIEHVLLFQNTPTWNAEEGDVRCLVWAFVFYGKMNIPAIDSCTPYPRGRKSYDSGDNLYYIRGCNRCS
jgi:hypothetical protein